MHETKRYDGCSVPGIDYLVRVPASQGGWSAPVTPPLNIMAPQSLQTCPTLYMEISPTLVRRRGYATKLSCGSPIVNAENARVKKRTKRASLFVADIDIDLRFVEFRRYQQNKSRRFKRHSNEMRVQCAGT